MSIKIIACGLVYCTVCAPKDMTIETIEKETNMELPTGISSRWRLSDNKAFNTGEPNPCQCDQLPDRQHYLMSC